jgi:phosphoglycerate dehydrogenase-like enzyme
MFSTNPQLSTEHASHGTRAVRPVVLATLTPAEQKDFLPDALWAEVQQTASAVHVADSSRMSTDQLAQTLTATRSEVLLACWKTPPLPAVLPTDLRYVCYLAGSVKRLATRQHVERGLLITNWDSSISRVVAEGALQHILSCLRRAGAWAVLMHGQGAWKDDRTETLSLFGRTVGLHGFGRVARELVRLLRPFDVTIRVFAPDVTPTMEREWSVRRVDSLEALFTGSDIVVELVPLLPETYRVVKERHLRLLRPGGVFVNVARGDVVDEEALVRVAQENRVQFGLDVFSIEPLPRDHPLRGMLNVSLTPHIAGPTTDRRRDAGAWSLKNLQAFASGRPLLAPITVQNYDAST